MLKSELPLKLDVWELFKSKAVLNGTLELIVGERLQGLIVDSAIPLTVSLAFTLDSDGHKVLVLQIEGSATLLCQRCLEPLEHTLAIHSQLVPEADWEKADCPSEYDPLPIVRDRIILRELIEEEIILALPMVPMHMEQCRELNE